MENQGRNTEEARIQGLLGGYLALRFSDSGRNAVGTDHLDEDALSAFVEGRLGEREAAPMVHHLVDCSFCRHITSELVRLDLAFADEVPATILQTHEPTKVSEVLNRILSRIFGTREDAVFAHSETDEEKETEDDPPEEKKD